MLYDIILEPVFRFIFTLPPPTPGLMIQYLSQRYLLLKNLAEELNFGSVCIHHFYLLYDTNIATSLINYHFQKRNQVGKNCEGKLYLHHHHHLHHLQQLQSNISQVFNRYHHSPESHQSSLQ